MFDPIEVPSLCLVASQVHPSESPYVTITFGAQNRSESVRLTVPPVAEYDDVRDWVRQMLAAACEAL